MNYGADGTTATAVPNAGYHFVDWTDGVLTATRTDTNVVANLSVTANFAINTYTLIYTAGKGGTITGTSPQTVNYGAAGRVVTAVPNTGYHFVNWSDGVRRPRGPIRTSCEHQRHRQLRDQHLHPDLHRRRRRHHQRHHAADGERRRIGTKVTAVPNTGYHFVDWSDGLLTAFADRHERDRQPQRHRHLRIRHLHPDLHRRYGRDADRGHAADA